MTKLETIHKVIQMMLDDGRDLRDITPKRIIARGKDDGYKLNNYTTSIALANRRAVEKVRRK